MYTTITNKCTGLVLKINETDMSDCKKDNMLSAVSMISEMNNDQLDHETAAKLVIHLYNMSMELNNNKEINV